MNPKSVFRPSGKFFSSSQILFEFNGGDEHFRSKTPLPIPRLGKFLQIDNEVGYIV